MIHDSKAEALEARGLYRRAAERWAEVIMRVDGDKAREEAAKRRAECIRKAARPPAKLDNFEEMRETISQAHAGVGLHQPNGKAFRKYPGAKNYNP
ncbi:PerC family transcriptional regulator [Escherichia coli]|uniref:PerC family transcriptional regulator n=1 Tax=Escherichia coli TaxID=562 RepID=UPI0010CBA6ED|nr:PerC family transcriptional regulator [Escherichia coli]GDH85745.1 transcriptional regulator PchE [Escherichia coli]